MRRQNPSSNAGRSKSNFSRVASEREEFGLSYQEFVFCQRYLIHFNQTKAALEAGKSSASAYQRGYEIRRRPRVKAYLDAKMEEHNLSSASALASMSDQARASLEDVLKIDEDGKVTFDQNRAIESGAIRHIKRLRLGKNGSFSVELVDRLAILKKLVKLSRPMQPGREPRLDYFV